MEISVFASDKNPNALRRQMTWDELCTSLRNPYPATTPKNRLPMWSPAVFRGDKRASSNVEQVSCLVFDVDEQPVPSLEDMGRALGEARWFAHASSSATLLTPRWRLLVELPRAVTREEHAKLWLTFAQKLGFPVGSQSKDASRAWYAPRFCDDGSFVTSAAAHERTA